MNNENEKVVEKGSKVNWNVIIAAAIMVIVIGICVVLLLFSNSKIYIIMFIKILMMKPLKRALKKASRNIK